MSRVFQYPGEPLGGVCNDLICNYPAAAFKVDIRLSIFLDFLLRIIWILFVVYSLSQPKNSGISGVWQIEAWPKDNVDFKMS